MRSGSPVQMVFDCAVLFHLASFCRSKGLSAEDAACGRTGRFLVILCEPIGSYRAETLSAEFRRDLEDGINEQIFTDEEYARMFDAAGLVATRAVIDGGSFKAILSCDGAVRSIDTTSSAPTRPSPQPTQLCMLVKNPQYSFRAPLDFAIPPL